MTPENNERIKWVRTKYPICNPLEKPIDPGIQKQILSEGPNRSRITGPIKLFINDLKRVLKTNH